MKQRLVMKEFALLGAKSRLMALESERQAILNSFPQLSLEAPARKGSPRVRRMTKAARQEISARMKRYWAGRRKQEKGTAK
jgi:hypothetical protein